MEIAIIGKSSLKIKGKHASIAVNPMDKSSDSPAAILIGNPTGIKTAPETVIIDGPGEYEIGGIKISGIRADTDSVYTISVDDVTVLVGSLSALAKVQTKLQEANVVVVQAEAVADASFITGFTPSAVLFFGEKASETIETFEKEGIQTQAKFQVTADKLPQEMVTVLLQ